MLLAADIGGTWVRLQALSRDGGWLAGSIAPSADFSGLDDAINQFRQQHGLAGFAAACIGLPGPVSGRQAVLTNLPWQVDADWLEQHCGIDRVQLVNDFQAAACGVDELSAERLLVLNPGQPQAHGHRLVVGAGTGLGVAPVFVCGERHIPVACEGGHMSFAPADDLQQDLLRWLWRQWEHVSWERILSGPGLVLLHGFLSGLEHPRLAGEITAAEVSARAGQGDPVACQTLSAFVAMYGSYLGSLAMFWPAPGGIYIAGGVAGKISHWMQQAGFLQAMQAKGRMAELVCRMPVYLVRDKELGLRGAARLVRQLIDSQAGGK